MTVPKCRGCNHPTAGHYRARDPDYEALDSMYCGQDDCMCWERYAINRDNKGPLTPERKPPKP